MYIFYGMYCVYSITVVDFLGLSSGLYSPEVGSIFWKLFIYSHFIIIITPILWSNYWDENQTAAKNLYQQIIGLQIVSIFFFYSVASIVKTYMRLILVVL